MACSNCFNGCSEIISDQCVRYTGVEISALDISNGDTLASVESKITSFILNLSTGNGIIPVIDSSELCSLVSGFLPESGDITLNDVISALLQSICALKTSVTAIESTLTILNANYTIGCLTGVTTSSDTHDILQAAINKLCSTATDLTALQLDVSTNYVELADLNTLIQAYLNSNVPSNLNSNKMVPYIAYEYYGPLTSFDATGAGSGVWENVYLCNGNNGTPDKRGRVAVGTTDGTMQGGLLSTVVDPSISGNPNYTLAGTSGTNTVTLTNNQIPSHSHTATTTVVDPGHQHSYQTRVTNNRAQFSNTEREVTIYQLSTLQTASATTGITVSTAIGNTGGGLGHPNVQPTIGAYYIMYIP
jgi:microcystin-dependent protein